MNKISLQHGKRRHVSKNTVTPSRKADTDGTFGYSHRERKNAAEQRQLTHTH